MKKDFDEWVEKRDLGDEVYELIKEDTQRQRYSVEVNYRTKQDEVLEATAKITLGYISASIKNCGYHTKLLFAEKPFRVVVSTRNWDDGEWVGIICYNHKDKHYVIGKGYYNKDRKTISVQSTHKCFGDSASELVKELRNVMEKLKRETPRENIHLKPVKLKRGPKQKKF